LTVDAKGMSVSSFERAEITHTATPSGELTVFLPAYNLIK
jgi:hypothetical protein